MFLLRFINCMKTLAIPQWEQGSCPIFRIIQHILTTFSEIWDFDGGDLYYFKEHDTRYLPDVLFGITCMYCVVYMPQYLPRYLTECNMTYLKRPPKNEMSGKKKYFTSNFMHLIHSTCQILLTFTSHSHSVHPHWLNTAFIFLGL
jgi:hypothetical protein